MVLFFLNKNLRELNKMVLSKADILNGANTYEEYEIKSAGGSICLRPLTIGEVHKISQMKNKALGDYTANQKGVTSKKRVKAQLEAQAKMNMEKITVADNKADIHTVLWGLDNNGNPEKFTSDEILGMNPKVFFEILDKVKEISHMEDDDVEDDVDDFPEDK